MSDSPSDRITRRREIMLASLPHVSFDGWTDQAIARGVESLGLPVADAARYFPGGAREMLVEFSLWADEEMAAVLAGTDLSDMRFRDRIAAAVMTRLHCVEPYREAVRRSIGFLALPGNVRFGVKALYRTVDTIWRLAGDRSSDFSFYSKRALLAGVVSATTLYWLDDASEDASNTAAFLDRRIGDVMRIQTVRGKGEQIAACLPDPFRILRAVKSRMPSPPRI